MYLVDGLSHVVLFHWNIVANQLLHRPAQHAVLQERLHVLLMLWMSKYVQRNSILEHR